MSGRIGIKLGRRIGLTRAIGLPPLSTRTGEPIVPRTSLPAASSTMAERQRSIPASRTPMATGSPSLAAATLSPAPASPAGMAMSTWSLAASSKPLRGKAQQEALGVASGSGIFTQTGGINCPYQQGSGAAGYSYNSIALGWSKGGYGEYDLSGGSVGVNAIFVGGNSVSCLLYASNDLAVWHGRVQPNGRLRRLRSARAGPIRPSVC